MNLGAPEGFSVSGRDELLVVADDQREAAVASGLDRLESWTRLLDRGEVRSGRGSTARISLETGLTIRIKQLRRGGLLERLWHDRFFGSGRLVENLAVPLIVRSLGVATPEPVALMLSPGPPGLFRGWIAFEELADATDLAEAFTAGPVPSREERLEVMSLVRRMHDAGVEHRDLNLGNLMLRRSAGRTQVYVIDLDRARVSTNPLAFGKRQQALRRLERSLVKESGRRDETDWIYEDYAGASTDLRDRLGRGRAFGRRILGLHRH